MLADGVRIAFDAGLMDRRPTIWIVTDGKAGHEAQSEGLVGAIERLIGGATVERLSPGETLARAGGGAGAPALAIGAGSATHRALLACRARLGAKAVVLMNPGFWRRARFDLVVAPAHDGLREGRNVVCTRGAINLVRPFGEKDERRGLILVGGPSKHHGWDDASMAAQVREVAERSGDVRWTLTTSRRTPATFLGSLADVDRERLDVWPVERTTREWLQARYAESGAVWASEDSVSMVYEALTSGARVGLLRVPRRRVGRVVRGVDALARDGLATWIDDWRARGELRRAPERLDEASRVAAIVIERFALNRCAS